MQLIAKAGVDYVGVTTPFYCLDADGRLLMHKRGEACRDERGRWDTGSGKLEVGLEPEQNVLKELMEEYGCRGEIIDRLPVHHIFRDMDGVRTHWMSEPFFIRVNPADVRICEPDKMVEIGWFRLDAMPSPIHSGFEYTMMRYHDQFFHYMVVPRIGVAR